MIESSSPNQSTLSAQPTNVIVLPNNEGSSSIIVIAVAVIIVVFFVVIATLILVLAVAVCVKVKKTHKDEVTMARNDAYGTILSDLTADIEQDTYDYPNMSLQTGDSMDIQQNTAYAILKNKP